MRWTSTAILSGLLLLGFAAASPAQESAEGEQEASEETQDIRPYIEYSGGVIVVPNQNLTGARDFSTNPNGTRFGGKFETDEPGWMVGGAVGARIWDSFRTELNLSWRTTDIDRMHVGGKPPADGDLSLFAALINVYGDLDFDWGVNPFAGVGIGYGLISLDAESDDFTANRAISVDADDSVFVWNFMAGVNVPISEVTEFSVGYRYLATTDPDFNARKVNGVGTGGATEPRRFESEFDSHEVTLGVRFTF
jgi:opacity protein-like surface antigen